MADKEEDCTNSKRNCSPRSTRIFFVSLSRFAVSSAAASLKTRDYVPVLPTGHVILCGYWHHFLCSFEAIATYPERFLSAGTPLTVPSYRILILRCSFEFLKMEIRTKHNLLCHLSVLQELKHKRAVFLVEKADCYSHTLLSLALDENTWR